VGLNLEGEDDTTVYFPFEWIVDAKLVLNDELMKRGAQQRAARVGADGEDAEGDDTDQDLGEDAEDDIDLSESEED
jgi:ribosome maturation factor RimP